jgi:ribonuclease PH
VGLIEDDTFLDLQYEEDVAAAVDFNLVLNENLNIIEVQGTAEEGSFSRQQMNQILAVGELGIEELLAAQQAAFL